jgi:predicted permease
VEGRPEPGAKENTSSGYTRVTAGFFETLGNRIVTGRSITEDDSATTQNVAVVNEAFARKFFKGENPIGRHFGPGMLKYAGMFTIVGVAADMRYMAYDFDKPVSPMFYMPEAQVAHFQETALNSGDAWSHYLYNVVLWAPGHPVELQVQVKKALADIDPSLVVQGVDKYADVLAGDFQQQSMIATLTLLFGGLGLVLAAVGLYGVTAYTVEQRTSEIGVRMALGADRASVVRMVLRGAFLQVGIGLALGIPAAILAGRAMAGQLYGVRPWDPAMLGAATVLLGLAAFLAAVIPARRAAGLDPVDALRAE